MKINPFSEAFRFIGLTTARDRDPGSPQGQTQDQRQGKKKNPADTEAQVETIEVTDEKVKLAVEAFGSDAHAKSNGLAASVTGQGPGMRVVLRDRSGATLRQFTGEEFLKLRASATQDTGRRGKLLDQKL